MDKDSKIVQPAQDEAMPSIIVEQAVHAADIADLVGSSATIGIYEEF